MSDIPTTIPDIPTLPLVYVSGPYRADTLLGIMRNIGGAWEDAAEIWRMGAAVICPHMNTAGFSEVFGPNSVISGEQCIQGDLVMIARCDAIFMRPGWYKSKGAKVELKFAVAHKIPVYFSRGYLADDIANHTIGKRSSYLTGEFTSSEEYVEAKSVTLEPKPCQAPLHPCPFVPNELPPGTNPKDAVGRAKTPFHLVPESANRAEAEVMRLGADKYGAYNWRTAPVNASVYVSALRRHMSAWFDGEDNDPESGHSHLAHARANLGILLDAQHCSTLIDDRPVVALPPQDDGGAS